MEIKQKPLSKPTLPDTAAAEKQLRDVATLYEKQFLREMVKQMRTSVTESELMPASFGEKYYREQLDHQYVESWGDKGGIGLGKLIYDQLLERYGERLGIKIPKEKPQGPLPLTYRDQWTGRVQTANKSLHFEKSKEPREAQAPLPIESPWEGRWLGSFELGNGLKAGKIEHQGVISTLVGDFHFGGREVGSLVAAGDRIGTLAPQAKDFYWRLDSKGEESAPPSN